MKIFIFQSSHIHVIHLIALKFTTYFLVIKRIIQHNLRASNFYKEQVNFHQKTSDKNTTQGKNNRKTI